MRTLGTRGHVQHAAPAVHRAPRTRVGASQVPPRSTNSDTAATPRKHTDKITRTKTPTLRGGGTRSGVTPKHLYYRDIKAPGRRGGGEWQLPASPPPGIPPQSTAASRAPPTHSSHGGRARSCVRQRRGHRFAERAAANGRRKWVGGVGGGRSIDHAFSCPGLPSQYPPSTHLLLSAGAPLVLGQRAARGGHRFQQLRHRASVG